MARKKRERGNGQGTVAPRRNKQDKIIGYRGAFFGPDGKRHWVSAKTKTECWSKLTGSPGRWSTSTTSFTRRSSRR
jgi:hypothetical protein